MPAESVQVKATRLLDEGRVEPHVGTESFEVMGDSGTYMVVVGEGVRFCSCPATVPCSHIVAAERWFRAERAARNHTDVTELGRYMNLLAERHNYEEVGT